MLQERRILVTGGSSGIGRELVHEYVSHGAEAWAVARTADALDKAVADLPAGRAHTVAADLTTEAGRRAVATSVEHHGGRLDVVVHAAGLLGPRRPLADYPRQDWYSVFEANVSAVHFLHQQLIAFLEASQAPVVIGVSSTVGRTGRGGWGMYAISKHALEGWLEVLDDEWRGSVYSVNPGGTATPMRAEAVPDEDPATIPSPADIAPIFLRLAHPANPEPSGARLEAREWIGQDPWEGIA
ncbi:MAG: SDR family NAD(P)-dependent oxidoreductase [Acidimicrobiia bacterium]